MIKQVSVEDCKIVSELAILLWEDNEINNLEEDFLTDNVEFSHPL